MEISVNLEALYNHFGAATRSFNSCLTLCMFSTEERRPFVSNEPAPSFPRKDAPKKRF